MTMREEIEEYISCSMTDEGVWVGDAGSIVAIVERHTALASRQSDPGTVGEEARKLAEKIINGYEYKPNGFSAWPVEKLTAVIAAAMREREKARPKVDDLLLQEICSLHEKLKIAVEAIKAHDPNFDAILFLHRVGSVDLAQLMEEMGAEDESAQPRAEVGASGGEYTDDEIEEIERRSRELGAGCYVPGISKSIGPTPSIYVCGDREEEVSITEALELLTEDAIEAGYIYCPQTVIDLVSVLRALLARAPHRESDVRVKELEAILEDDSPEGHKVTNYQFVQLRMQHQEQKARAEAVEAERDALREALRSEHFDAVYYRTGLSQAEHEEDEPDCPYCALLRAEKHSIDTASSPVVDKLGSVEKPEAVQGDPTYIPDPRLVFSPTSSSGQVLAEKPEATGDTTLVLGRGPNGRGIAVVEEPEARTCETCATSCPWRGDYLESYCGTHWTSEPAASDGKGRG